jgi:hypothetical protein
MALKPYTVKVGDVETTLLLSDEDARTQGLLKETAAKQAKQPANKARTARNKKS